MPEILPRRSFNILPAIRTQLLLMLHKAIYLSVEFTSCRVYGYFQRKHKANVTCFLPLTPHQYFSPMHCAKLNVDRYLQNPTCGFLPIFNKAIPIQRNGLTEVSSWSSSKFHSSRCGEILITEVVFVDHCGVPHTRSMASSSSGILAAEDFTNRSQISPQDSLHSGCEMQCKPQKFLVFLHAGANILWLLDEWKYKLVG